MTNHRRHGARRMILGTGSILLASALVSGCAGLFERKSAPLDWYLLSSGPGTASAPAATPAGGQGGAIYAVAPVRVPEYLSQKWVVTRTGQNELHLAENAQWAAPLGDMIGSVMAENISLLIPSDRVVQLPVSASVPVDFEIRVEVVRFERQPDGTVELVARWTVFAEGGRRLVAMERTSLHQNGVADEYPAISAAMSGLLFDLSRQVAGALRTSAAPLS